MQMSITKHVMKSCWKHFKRLGRTMEKKTLMKVMFGRMLRPVLIPTHSLKHFGSQVWDGWQNLAEATGPIFRRDFLAWRNVKPILGADYPRLKSGRLSFAVISLVTVTIAC